MKRKAIYSPIVSFGSRRLKQLIEKEHPLENRSIWKAIWDYLTTDIDCHDQTYESTSSKMENKVKNHPKKALYFSR